MVRPVCKITRYECTTECDILHSAVYCACCDCICICSHTASTASRCALECVGACCACCPTSGPPPPPPASHLKWISLDRVQTISCQIGFPLSLAVRAIYSPACWLLPEKGKTKATEGKRMRPDHASNGRCGTAAEMETCLAALAYHQSEQTNWNIIIKNVKNAFFSSQLPSVCFFNRAMRSEEHIGRHPDKVHCVPAIATCYHIFLPPPPPSHDKKN